MATPLDRYMKQQKMTDADLAPLIRRDRSMVNKLRNGAVRPTLDVAAAIERATSGVVTMNSWVEPRPTPEPAKVAA